MWQVTFTELNVVSVGRTMVNIWAACLRCAAGTCELGFQIFPLGLLLSLCGLGRDPNSRQSPESFLLTGILQLAFDREIRVPVHSAKPRHIFPSTTMWRWKLF